MDEADLLARSIRGDPAAWERLVSAYAGVMFAVVERCLRTARRTEAEDVVQAVFLKLWEDDRRRLRTFRGGSRLGTWLVAIARREALDGRRK
ncbi:MAG: sigma factor, partial [Planctomycetota bacterium]|nr:sigma factor [Planctomycetota bacterium]